MYEPWSVMGVDELKQPTYVMALIEAATVGNCESSDKANVAAVAARRDVDDIMAGYVGVCMCEGGW